MDSDKQGEYEAALARQAQLWKQGTAGGGGGKRKGKKGKKRNGKTAQPYMAVPATATTSASSDATSAAGGSSPSLPPSSLAAAAAQVQAQDRVLTNEDGLLVFDCQRGVRFNLYFGVIIAQAGFWAVLGT